MIEVQQAAATRDEDSKFDSEASIKNGSTWATQEIGGLGWATPRTVVSLGVEKRSDPR